MAVKFSGCLRGVSALSILSLLCLCGCAPTPVENKNSVVIWHWMTDRQPAFEELSRRYEELTGVRVTFELYAPSDAYSQKIRAAAQSVSLPDIFGILGEKRDFSSFVKAGHVLNITPYMSADSGKWKNVFFSKALAVNEFSSDNTYGVTPGIYGVPIDITTIQMVYNKKLLKQIGGNPNRPPATLEEFLALGPKIKASGIQGLVSGWGEVWMIDCMANNYAFNVMGKDKVLATIRGDVPYTDPDWIKVFEIFNQMQNSGVLANGLVTMVNKNAEQLFANEKAVFAFNGSWCVNVYKGMNPGLEFGAMLPPTVSSRYPMVIWGGAGSSFMVNARSPRKEEAVKFLRWLTDREQQVFLAEITLNLPANKDSLKKISDVLAQFADDIETSTHPNVWGVSEFPAVVEALDKGIQSIVIGEKTSAQVAEEVQKIKQRELSKKNNK
ncbi:MAG: extracellular solute-binding protein [Candidatus Omnitrophota bacterium]